MSIIFIHANGNCRWENLFITISHRDLNLQIHILRKQIQFWCCLNLLNLNIYDTHTDNIIFVNDFIFQATDFYIINEDNAKAAAEANSLRRARNLQN